MNAGTSNFKKAISETRLPNICFHDLRHTVATLLLSKEINPKIIQEQLGHSSINLTLHTYSHVIKSMRGIAANALEDVVGSD
ncbi:MAG TPA: tyrosine-type recombinase/integrase [Anaerolineales bacterium]|nr:tyrosine-type recombinase/integrase [Anaerolineales bacterium]